MVRLGIVRWYENSWSYGASVYPPTSLHPYVAPYSCCILVIVALVGYEDIFGRSHCLGSIIWRLSLV